MAPENLQAVELGGDLGGDRGAVQFACLRQGAGGARSIVEDFGGDAEFAQGVAAL